MFLHGQLNRPILELLLKFGVNLTPAISHYWDIKVQSDKTGQLARDAAWLRERGVELPRGHLSLFSYQTLAAAL